MPHRSLLSRGVFLHAFPNLNNNFCISLSIIPVPQCLFLVAMFEKTWPGRYIFLIFQISTIFFFSRAAPLILIDIYLDYL